MLDLVALEIRTKSWGIVLTGAKVINAISEKSKNVTLHALMGIPATDVQVKLFQ